MKTKGQLCNLCGGDDFKLVKETLRDAKEKFKVYGCCDCGHIQILPRPTPQEDKEFYDVNAQDKARGKDIDYHKLYENNLFDTTRHLHLIEELDIDKSSRFLDIGSGYGFFVAELYNSGYKDVTGLEISEQRRRIAAEHSPVEMIDPDINDPDVDIGRFDVVTLFHVLEHMAEPIKFVERIVNLLNPGSIFICEVPNANELLLETCNAYNDFYWIRAHLNYFNEKSLLACFKQAGMKNVQTKYQQRYGLINLSNWLTFGKPQIDKPVFTIDKPYLEVEEFYKKDLEDKGRSDALIAIAKV